MTRILVVDDDEGTRLTFESILRLESYYPTTASSGRVALRMIERDSRQFDLVLIDLRLPDMSGLEVLVGAVAKGLRAAVYTTFDVEPESEIAARNLGAVAFVDRMIDQNDLLELVRRNLDEPYHTPPWDVHRGGGAVSAEPVASREECSKTRPGHAAARWAKIVVSIARLQSDVVTIAAWGHEIGVSPSTLKRWCELAQVNAGDSLDFARLLRVVCRHAGRRVDWLEELAIGTPRTLEHLLHRAGLRTSEPVPSLENYLAGQQLITLPRVIAAIRQALEL